MAGSLSLLRMIFGNPDCTSAFVKHLLPHLVFRATRLHLRSSAQTGEPT
jgi:hypothetical protein